MNPCWPKEHQWDAPLRRPVQSAPVVTTLPQSSMAEDTPWPVDCPGELNALLRDFYKSVGIR